RRARRARDTAFRVSTSRARTALDRRAARRPSRPPLRRGADRTSRPARPRLLEGGGGRPRTSDEAGLGADPLVGTGGQPAPASMSFDGASVFVTGGSRGIGREIALRFAALGAARVAIGYLRNDRAAEEAADELRRAGAEPVLVRGNVASERVAREVAELGPLDVLVHAAATGVIRPALETEDRHFDWTLAANARAFLSLVRAAAPAMQPGSTIIGVSSLGSTRVLENYNLVGASTAALEAI